MIPLLLVGDGPRDAIVLPPLIRRALGVEIRCEFRPWARLHSAGRRYERKLVFALAQARDSDMVGLVAAVDADKDSNSRDKLGRLRAGREQDRTKHPPIPTGIG